jgi:hypothetical protein
MNLNWKYEVTHCSLPMTFTQALLVFPAQRRGQLAENGHPLAFEHSAGHSALSPETKKATPRVAFFMLALMPIKEI